MMQLWPLAISASRFLSSGVFASVILIRKWSQLGCIVFASARSFSSCDGAGGPASFTTAGGVDGRGAGVVGTGAALTLTETAGSGVGVALGEPTCTVTEGTVSTTAGRRVMK